jgi:hypothetical protein
MLLPILLVVAACTSEEGDSSASQTDPPEDPQSRPPEWEETTYGLHMDVTYDDDPAHRLEAIELAASVGVQISRNSFLWHRMQPTPDQEVDWSVPDSVVEELTGRGIEPLFTAYGSPSWANGVPHDDVEDADLYVPQDDADFDQWVDRYADFMRAAAERYRGQVTKWEVWNEQNGTWFWKPAPDLDRYVEFFQAVRGAILQGNPDAQVAPGGLASLTATGESDITGVEFLQGLLDRGVRPDYISIHPYSTSEQDPDEQLAGQNNFDDIERIRQVLVEAGHEVPVWVTEWGWRSDEVGEDAQAEFLERSLERIATDYPYVTVATYFLDYDRPEFTQGLFDTSMRPKPSAEVFESFVAQNSG